MSRICVSHDFCILRSYQIRELAKFTRKYVPWRTFCDMLTELIINVDGGHLITTCSMLTIWPNFTDYLIKLKLDPVKPTTNDQSANVKSLSQSSYFLYLF